MRKGVSELVAAVVLIGIVLAASVIYYYYFTVENRAGLKSFIDVSRISRDRSIEMLSLISSHKYLSGSTTTVSLYVYNYGYKDVDVEKIYLNNYTSSFKIYDVNGDEVSVLATSRMYLINASINVLLIGKVNVIIVTSSGKVFSFEVS